MDKVRITVGGKPVKTFMYFATIDGVFSVNKKGEWIKIEPFRKRWWEFWKKPARLVKKKLTYDH